MDLSHLEPARPSGLDKPSPEAEALSKIAKAVGGGSVTRMAGSFSQPSQYNHDVNFTQARQTAGARQATGPRFQPMQFDSGQRVEWMQKAASQYAPQEPDVTVTVQQPETQRGARPERPQPGTYTRPQPMPEAAPEPMAPTPQTTRFPQPQARGQVFGRQTGDIKSPYGNRVGSAYEPKTVSTEPGAGGLGGQFEVPDLDAQEAYQVYKTPRGQFEGVGEPGQVGTGWPGDREAAEDENDFMHDLPGRGTGTGWPGTPQRPSSVSAAPSRGALGGQFGGDLSSMRDAIRSRTSGHSGMSVLDQMRPARRGVSDAIRAAGTDLPEAVL